MKKITSLVACFVMLCSMNLMASADTVNYSSDTVAPDENQEVNLELLRAGCLASSDGNHHWEVWTHTNETGLISVNYSCRNCGYRYTMVA